VLPHHATRQGTVDACQRSLRRLGTDRLDLYLLHWRGRVPVEETVAAFQTLVSRGLIRSWGLSNFDVPDLDQMVGLPGGDRVQTDQVLYNLARRGPEHDLIPWCRGRRMPLMVYSPVDHGRLVEHRAVRDMAVQKGITPAQLAIAWVLRLPDMFAVAKASTRRTSSRTARRWRSASARRSWTSSTGSSPRRTTRSRSTSSNFTSRALSTTWPAAARPCPADEPWNQPGTSSPGTSRVPRARGQGSALLRLPPRREGRRRADGRGVRRSS
jgi:diketogulonate reductase-like aldo/keto reductase